MQGPVAQVRICVLGPIAATVGGEPVALGPLKRRTVLALLVSRAGADVPADTLVDALWGERPPPSAANNVRSHVHLLRQSLGRDVISGVSPSGYRLHPERVVIDVVEFDALCAAAREATGRGDLAGARDSLVRAIALRSDRAYADLGDLPALAEEIRSIEERVLLATQQLVDAELGLGSGADLVAELSTLTSRHPYRERFWEQLMLALYRAGRQSDALRAYHQARATLSDGLGVEPGPALQAIQRRILQADPALLPESRPNANVSPNSAVVPVQLPLDIRGFAGREEQLRALDAVLDTAEGQPAATAICAVSGPAGVGKSTLVVHWAHSVTDRFPDGQLYHNLRGFDADGLRVNPTEALRELLEALGVRRSAVPDALPARAAMYRSVLAGRRMLIVLDNARDDDQVRPLLPGSPGCVVLVTSRNRLAGLTATEGATPILLDLLDPAAARLLLAGRIGADRLRAELAAADEIADRCTRLPLALAVVAARAATNPGFRLTALAAELAEAQAPLDAFDGPDPATDVRTVFSWSYRALSPDAARLFRLLGLHPGPHATVAAAASVAGEPVAAVRLSLAQLTRAHLLIEPQPGRYAFHDLLRAYAAELVDALEPAPLRIEATCRMFDHYMGTAQLAATLLRPRDSAPPAIPGVILADLADRADAMAWFAAEHAVLIANMVLCFRPTEHDAAGGPHPFARHRQAVAAYLRASSDFRDFGDRYQVAITLQNLGDAYQAISDDESARRLWKEALVALEELGHEDAERVRAKLQS